MAKLRSVNILFWSDSYIEDLNPHGKLVFNYLLTNSLTQIGGFYKISVKKISDETGITREEISDLLIKFEDDKKIIYREGWLVLRNSLKHQNLNPNMAKGVVMALVGTPAWVQEAVIIPDEVVSMVQEAILSAKTPEKAKPLANALKALLNASKALPNPFEPLPNAYLMLSKEEEEGEVEGEEEAPPAPQGEKPGTVSPDEKPKPAKQKLPSAELKPSDEVLVWLDAIAAATGAKNRETLANFPAWDRFVRKCLSENRQLPATLRAIESELTRLVDMPQFFSPDGVLKILQNGARAGPVKASNGHGKMPALPNIPTVQVDDGPKPRERFD